MLTNFYSRYSVIALIAAFSLVSCTTRTDGTGLAFENVKVAEGFREELDLTKKTPEVINLNVDGALDICVYDSLFCVMSSDANGFVKVFDKRTFSGCGSFLRKGRGPGELLNIPTSHRFSRSSDGRLFFLDRKQVVEVDVAASLRNGQTEATPYKENLPDLIDYYLVVSDSLNVIKRINNGFDGYTRQILRGKVLETTKNQESLNKIVLDAKGDPGKFNLLGSMMSYNASEDVVVEASLMTNTINLYSLFSDFAMTLCVGDRPDDIQRLEKAEYGTTGDTFIDLKPCEGIFLVLYQKEKGFNVVMAFQWDGEPVARIKVPDYVTKVCTDLDQNVLYALDGEEERILKWEL